MSLKNNIIAFFVIGIIGTLSHFVYDWSGENPLLAGFFPINESVWEHLKLLFFPTLLYSAIEYFLTKEKPKNYLSAIAFSLLCGMLSIVVLFYTASGIIGKNLDFINISIYYLSLIIMLIKKRKYLRKNCFTSPFYKKLSISVLFLFTFLFIIWSSFPPDLGIFTPPE